MIPEVFNLSASESGLRLVGGIVFSFCVYLSQSNMPVQAAAPMALDEVNNIRVYKQVARSTVLIASAYISHHPVTQASWKGLGSGVLIDNQGLIITNAHVVDGTSKITVTLHDGKQLSAELVGSDPQTDVALIRVALPKGSAGPAQLGDSDTIGKPVMVGRCQAAVILPSCMRRGPALHRMTFRLQRSSGKRVTAGTRQVVPAWARCIWLGVESNKTTFKPSPSIGKLVMVGRR